MWIFQSVCSCILWGQSLTKILDLLVQPMYFIAWGRSLVASVTSWRHLNLCVAMNWKSLQPTIPQSVSAVCTVIWQLYVRLKQSDFSHFLAEMHPSVVRLKRPANWIGNYTLLTDTHPLLSIFSLKSNNDRYMLTFLFLCQYKQQTQ